MNDSLRPGAASLLLVALTAACVARPPHRVDVSGDTIRASTKEEARLAAKMLPDVRRSVEALVPGLVERELEVWIGDYRSELGGSALVRGSYVERSRPGWFPAGSIVLLEPLPGVLAHELVHALLGEEWRTLPRMLEEGLANVAAAEASGETADAWLLAARGVCGLPGIWVKESVGEGTLGVSLTFGLPSESDWTPERLYECDSPPALDEVLASFYGLGSHLALELKERVGMDGVLGICRRARAEGHDRVPLPWVLRACELDGPEPWMELGRRRLQHSDLGRLAAALGDLGFLERSYPVLALDGTPPTPAEWLAREPRLVDEATGETIRLADLPAFREAYLERLATLAAKR